MNNLLKYALGLVALGVSVYVVGKAWKKSQRNGMASRQASTNMSGMPR
jgi:hypothetical protein